MHTCVCACEFCTCVYVCKRIGVKAYTYMFGFGVKI